MNTGLLYGFCFGARAIPYRAVPYAIEGLNVIDDLKGNKSLNVIKS